ncbi:hypothetical protein JAB1_01220 [Janthinobacterium sp. MP5059B]|nr:hypothetical protein JAB1_01220 [Janthinobacterium sp. MP5059B]
MKKYRFPIDKFQADWMFSPIRNRLDSIAILMKTLKILLVNSPPSEEKVVGEVVLQVSKMSRIFLYLRKKYFQ